MPSKPVVWTHVACSGPLPWLLPPTRLAHTPAGCGHGGTRKSSTSRRVQTWSVSPAAMAGVWGCHRVAEPLPWVGSGCGSAGHTLAGGRQQFSDTWYNASCWRTPSAPLHSVETRRPSAAPWWRMLRLRRSMNAGLLGQPHAAHTCATASSVPNTTRCVTRTRRRLRGVLIPCAYSSPGRGIQRGWGEGPVA